MVLIHPIDKEKMRREFAILIDRCGCSRASLLITEEKAKKWTKEGLGKFKSHIPHCTPKKCFPTLYKLLYPNGGFNKISGMVRLSLATYKRDEKKC